MKTAPIALALALAFGTGPVLSQSPSNGPGKDTTAIEKDRPTGGVADRTGSSAGSSSPAASSAGSSTADAVTTLSNTPEVVSGGVGIVNRQRMMDEFKGYNMHLGFARTDGALLADVAVTIRDKAGKVVWSGNSPGPLLFARLQPGTYVVEASHEGHSKKQTISVGRGAGSMHYVHMASGSEKQEASAGSSRRGGSVSSSGN